MNDRQNGTSRGTAFILTWGIKKTVVETTAVHEKPCVFIDSKINVATMAVVSFKM
jgi:hypothetical protein